MEQSDTQLHIVHLVWSFDIGGMENGIVNLVNKSDPARLRFSIIAVSQLGEALNRITVPNVFVTELKKHAGNDWRIVGKLAHLLRCLKPNIVHTHGWGTYLEGALAALFARIPVLIHGEHGTTFFDKWRRVFAYRALKFLTTQFTTVSVDLAQILHSRIGISPERITYIPNGVDTLHFQPQPLVRRKVREALGVAEDEYVVGAVGRLVPVKGFDIFIESIQQLRASGILVRGVLVGDGPMRRELEQLAYQWRENIISFLGDRNDIANILQAFDVYVSTSYSEGMSNTILEAMAVALPVVATDVGGTPLLVEAERTGVLIPPGRSHVLIQTLETLRKCPEVRIRMGQVGRQRCEKQFSLTEMVGRYETMYRLCF